MKYSVNRQVARGLSFSVLAACVIVAVGCPAATPTDVNTQTDVLDEIRPNNDFDSTYVGDTIVAPGLLVYEVSRRRLVVDVDWTSSNSAVLKLVANGATRTVDGNEPGGIFQAVSEGDAVIIGTPRGGIKTSTGQPILYKRTVSVAGVPSSLRISPPGPLVMQVYKPNESVNGRALEQLHAIFRSASGRQMQHLNVKWSLPDGDVLAFYKEPSPTDPTTMTTQPRLAPSQTFQTIYAMKIGLARVVLSMEPYPGRTLPTIKPDTILVEVSAGSVNITTNPPGINDAETGQVVQMSVDARDFAGATISNPVVEWSSDKPSVASVDQTGKVTVLAPSAESDVVKIRALVPVLGLSAERSLSVYRKIAAVSVAPNPVSIAAGGAVRMAAHAVDASGGAVKKFLQNLTWTITSGADIVALDGVSFNGDTSRLVTALKPGEATIKIAHPSGPSTTLAVHVTPVAATISLSVQTGNTVRPVLSNGETVSTGNSLLLLATVRDANGNVMSEPLTVTPLQSSFARLTQTGANGVFVEGVSPGNVAVSIRSSSNPSVSAGVNVLITPATVGGTATRIAITSSIMPAVTQSGSTIQFSAVGKDIAGNNAVDCPIGWAMDDSHIGSINASGLATGAGAGTTAVRAFCTDHSQVGAAAQFTVKDATYGVTEVHVTPRFTYLAASSQLSLAASVVQNSGAAAPVSWEMFQSPVGVLAINPSGRITVPASTGPAFGGGAFITATAAGQTDFAWVTYGNAGTISGTMTSSSGQFLGGATASATPTGGGATVTTPIAYDGTFYIVGLPSGPYTVTVRQQGNPAAQTVSNVVVTTGNLTQVTLTPFALRRP